MDHFCTVASINLLDRRFTEGRELLMHSNEQNVDQRGLSGITYQLQYLSEVLRGRLSVL